jgi:dihydropteroate synthase
VIITHSSGRPKEKVFSPSYEDVVSEGRSFLIERSAYAQEKGIDLKKIIVDPGHDLNKNTWHSLELTRRLNELNNLGYPLLVSVSNKDFIAETLDLPSDQLGAGTVAALVICVLQGARILRVHDPGPQHPPQTWLAECWDGVNPHPQDITSDSLDAEVPSYVCGLIYWTTWRFLRVEHVVS